MTTFNMTKQEKFIQIATEVEQNNQIFAICNFLGLSKSDKKAFLTWLDESYYYEGCDNDWNGYDIVEIFTPYIALSTINAIDFEAIYIKALNIRASIPSNIYVDDSSILDQALYLFYTNKKLGTQTEQNEINSTENQSLKN